MSLLHTEVQNKGSDHQSSPPPITKDPGQCPHCDRKFGGPHGLTQHLGHDPHCKAIHEASINAETSSLSSATQPSGSYGSDHSPDQNENDVIAQVAEEPVALDIPQLGDTVGQLDDDDSSSMTESDSSDSDSDGDSTESDSDSEGGDEDAESDLPADDPHLNPPPQPINNDPADNEVELEESTDQYGNKVYIERYPSDTAGEPIYRVLNENNHPYPDVGQLADPEAFEIAHLLMASGLRALMPWKNNRDMLRDVDKLPHGPNWRVHNMRVRGPGGVEDTESWGRDPVEVLKQMVKSKQLGPQLQFKPIRKYTTSTREERIRDEGWTADRMWELQDEIGAKDPHATILPCVVSSDETKLTSFSGDKKAHPVYITVMNLPKHYRRKISKRANVLIGYLPVPKLDCVPDKEERRKARRNLFHQCLKSLLKPLAEACENGVEMECHDGGVRRIYPVLTAYVADYPEQCKVACTKTSHCPTCVVKPGQRGDLQNSAYRTRDAVIDAMKEEAEKGSAKFRRLGLFQVKPFWEKHKYTDMGCLLTPDLLHQLHKGVLKDHLTKWAAHIVGSKVIDERHKTMPEYHGMRHFKNGISSVSQWTGRELKEMAKVLLPVIADCNHEVVQAARSILDFVYLAHSSALTDGELEVMEKALRTFHAHKQVFRRNGALATKKGFHAIPKIHMISHYTHIIRKLGTPDGYNTETSERLHIDFAKLGYRASNKVNATKQMALYIQRIEALAMHASYLDEQVRIDQQNIKDRETTPELDNPLLEFAEIGDPDEEDEEAWDEWYDEEEAEDNDGREELAGAGVIVGQTVELEDFAETDELAEAAEVTGLRGHGWEQEQPPVNDRHVCFHPVPEIVLAKTPTNSGMSIDRIVELNSTDDLARDLTHFLRRENPNHDAPIRILSNTKLNLWSRARLFHSAPPFKTSEGPHTQVVRCQPAKIDRFERVLRPPRFDTVLVLRDKGKSGIHSK
ncbi:plasma membrane ATPase 4 [Ceratobasidium sp. AG-Ba]|nr:plasma membrane ATPase 4 [Ceratobasidium sp. AG-Ba]